jgi:hypothetical protein
MPERAADDVRVEGSWAGEIVDEAGAATQKRAVLLAREAQADRRPGSRCRVSLDELHVRCAASQSAIRGRTM